MKCGKGKVEYERNKFRGKGGNKRKAKKNVECRERYHLTKDADMEERKTNMRRKQKDINIQERNYRES